MTSAIFCNPFTLTVLPDDQQPECVAESQRLYWQDEIFWHRVTPGLLRWMHDCIERAITAFEASTPTAVLPDAISASIAFYETLLDHSGLSVGETPERPV